MMSGAKKRVPKRRFKEFLNAGDWEQRKLRNLLEQPITDGPHETPELYDSGIPFISVDAIVDNKIDFTKMRGYISKEYDDICAKKYKPQINDVYLVKSGATIGKVAIVDTYDDFNIWSPLAAMRCGSITNPYFLYILLQTQDLQSQVFNKASHGTQPNLSMRQLEKFTCKVPKIEEQKLISRFLKQLDDVITLHQHKLYKLEATKKALLQEMFPEKGQDKPKRRFKGFTDAWEQYKLADILSRRKENRRIDSAYPRLAFAAGQGVIPLSERRTNNRDQLISDEKNKKYLVTYYNDIVYNPANLKYGAIDRNKYGQGVISPIYVTFISNICSGFIEHIVKSHEFKEKALSFEEGTVTKRQAVNPDNLLKIDVVITPNSKEQEKISKLFELIDRFITLHQRKLDKLKNLKQAYLNEMFV